MVATTYHSRALSDLGDPDVVVAGGDRPWRRAAHDAVQARGLTALELEGDLDSVVDATKVLPHHVVVLGPRTEGNIVRAVAAMSAHGASPLVLGSATDDLELLLVLASGACGFLSCSATHDEIAGAAHAILAGRVVLPDAAGPALLDVLRGCGRGITVTGPDGERHALTQREWEILVLRRQGWSTAEIAARLVVSKVTVRTHLLALRNKLGPAGPMPGL